MFWNQWDNRQDTVAVEAEGIQRLLHLLETTG